MEAERRKKGSRRRPGELENAVLSILWDAGEPLSPSEVQERFGPGLTYATISTILTRLCSKRIVTRTARGRAHLYEPSVSRSDHVSEQARRLLAQGGDRPAVLQGFLDGLSKSDERELRRLLDRIPSERSTEPPAPPGT
jgi:predicted transcriptional regulator